MKSISLSVLGLAFLLAPFANDAKADGLLDPLGLFGHVKAFNETYPNRINPSRPMLSMPKLSMPKLSMPKLSMPQVSAPKFNWFSRPKQGSTAASVDRKFRTNWVTPKKFSTRASQAVHNTTEQVGNVTVATYNATANVLSPSKNIQRVQGISENISNRFSVPPNTLAKDDEIKKQAEIKKQGKQPWFSTDWFKRKSQPAENTDRSKAFPRLPLMHAE